MKKTAADIREEKLNEKLAVLAGKGDWDAVVAAMDAYDENNDRKHREHRDRMDITAVNRALDGEERYRTVNLLKLSCSDDWDDIIFSQRAEDLHELVTEESVSKALKGLTQLQKEVVLEHYIYSATTEELASDYGCSVRNIRKIRQRALEYVREAVTGSKKLLKDNKSEKTALAGLSEI